MKRLGAIALGFLTLAALTLLAQTPNPNPQASASTTSFTQLNALICLPAGASTTTYTCTVVSVLSPYNTWTVVTFVPDVSNTAASTLNFNGLGAKPIVAGDGTTALVAADLIAGSPYSLIYDGTSFRKIDGPDGAWTALAYANSWADFGSGLAPGKYRKDRNGIVHLVGVLACGTQTGGTVMFNMPAGYRVATTSAIAAFLINGTSVGRFGINPDGTMKTDNGITCGGGGFVSLENIQYSVY